jgi:hypothetical protein
MSGLYKTSRYYPVAQSEAQPQARRGLLADSPTGGADAAENGAARPGGDAVNHAGPGVTRFDRVPTARAADGSQVTSNRPVSAVPIDGRF